MMRLRRFLQARDWDAVRVWIALVALAAGTYLVLWRFPASSARVDCDARYARATTYADTLRIDRQAGSMGSKYGGWNCGMLRRAGGERGGGG